MNLRDITGDVGVDVLSFGGTKNGMMFGEAVVFFKRAYGKQFPFIRKQGMQLLSKMRFIAAQFDAYLTNDLWLKNAAHANEMARLLAKQLADIPGITITQPVESNAVFAILPKEAIPQIQQHSFFYVWNEVVSETRLMTAFDTTQRDVRRFVKAIQAAMKNRT